MHVRNSQAERRARSRTALLESAARHLSRSGYANLVLERVARDAGYTRGALYHQFADKDDLTLAVLRWVDEAWQQEVAPLVAAAGDPVGQLVALARGHAVFCRRDVARFGMALRMEFGGRDHPVAEEMAQVYERLIRRCARLISAGRRDGSIPPGPPAAAVARGAIGALEGAVIELEGLAPHDVLLAERVVRGAIGL